MKSAESGCGTVLEVKLFNVSGLPGQRLLSEIFQHSVVTAWLVHVLAERFAFVR